MTKIVCMKYRSKFEQKVAATLGPDYHYEALKLPYILAKNYVADFTNATTRTVVEAKGYLRDADERAKLVAVKQQHPDWNIILAFQAPNQRMPGMKMTHAEWARKHGFEVIKI